MSDRRQSVRRPRCWQLDCGVLARAPWALGLTLLLTGAFFFNRNGNGVNLAIAQTPPAGGQIAVVPPPVDAPVASAAASARRVLLGKSFFIIITVVHADGIEVNLPTVLKLGGALEEIRRTSEKRSNPDGSKTREFEVEVIAFSLGESVVAPIDITYTGRGSVGKVRTNPVVFEVLGVIGDGQGALRDIRPPIDVERRDLTLLYLGVGVMGALVGLALLIFVPKLLGRRTMTASRGMQQPLRTAADEALFRFQRIEEQGDLDARDLKPVYLEMSEILKGYMAKRFGFPASELTTLEIRNELAARPQGESAERTIRSWLEAADLVKFANQQASARDARDALDTARRFVRTYAGAEAEANAGAGAGANAGAEANAESSSSESLNG